MTLMNLRLLAARAGVMALVKTSLFSMVLAALAPAPVVAQSMEKKGTTPYVTHFIFRPLMSIDIPGLGTATNLEAVGTTQNMKGEKPAEALSLYLPRRVMRDVHRCIAAGASQRRHRYAGKWLTPSNPLILTGAASDDMGATVHLRLRLVRVASVKG